MNEIKCITSEGRKYGLWSFDEEKNMAFRKCKCCGISFYYSKSKYIFEQIKKQYEAIPLLEDFIKLSPDDSNLMSHLYKILSDVVDYVDDLKKEQLSHKMRELVLTPYISDENKKLIENFRQAIISDNNDLFFDTKERFEEYNADSLNPFISNERNHSR